MYYPPVPPQGYDDQKYRPAGIPIPTTPPGITVSHLQLTSPQMHHYSPYPSAPNAVSGTGRWSSGFCHCCDDPANCLTTAACPCITFGQIAEVLNHGSTCAALQPHV